MGRLWFGLLVVVAVAAGGMPLVGCMGALPLGGLAQTSKHIRDGPASKSGGVGLGMGGVGRWGVGRRMMRWCNIIRRVGCWRAPLSCAASDSLM